MEALTDAWRQKLLANRLASNGKAGAEWVASLDGVVPRLLAQWDLAPEPPFENLSYNYVAPVRTAEGRRAVLKVCFPGEDFLCEAEATRLFEGRACARLLCADLDAGALLLERLQPGDELHTLDDDAAETSAVAAIMRDIRRPYSGTFPFPRAMSWVEGARRQAAIPALKARYAWIERALDRLLEITADPQEEMLLHGDLHHDNILRGRDRHWVAIDPHGVLGDPAWEVAPFLFNRLDRHARPDWRAIIRRRADIISDELALPRDRVYAWSAVRAVQSAFWSLRDEPSTSGPIFEGALLCAEVLTEK